MLAVGFPAAPGHAVGFQQGFLPFPADGQMIAPNARQPAVLPDPLFMSNQSVRNSETAHKDRADNGGTVANKPPSEHHPERTLPTSFSFEGCGAAISYHLGVYGAVTEIFGKDLLQQSGVKWVGTSSGSIAALVAALGLDAKFWKERLQVLWGPLQDRCLGLLQVDEFVSEALDEMLEAFNGHAYDHLTDRLYVSVTNFPFTNTMISTWKSDKQIKDAILASCFIPATALFPVRIGFCFAIDGGFSLNNPRLDESTVLVSPARTHHSNIKPEAKARFRDLIGAPKPARFHALWLNGIQDTEDFFEPSQVHVREAAGPAPAQTSCGKCYYWAMRQRCCMMFRISLFWAVLFLQVLCMPLCWAAFATICKQNLRPKPEPPTHLPDADEPLTKAAQIQRAASLQSPDVEAGGGQAPPPGKAAVPNMAAPAWGGLSVGTVPQYGYGAWPVGGMGGGQWQGVPVTLIGRA